LKLVSVYQLSDWVSPSMFSALLCLYLSRPLFEAPREFERARPSTNLPGPSLEWVEAPEVGTFIALLAWPNGGLTKELDEPRGAPKTFEDLLSGEPMPAVLAFWAAPRELVELELLSPSWAGALRPELEFCF